jgi:hypothetical protein
MVWTVWKTEKPLPLSGFESRASKLLLLLFRASPCINFTVEVVQMKRRWKIQHVVQGESKEL